jgi:hypothetical protein
MALHIKSISFSIDEKTINMLNFIILLRSDMISYTHLYLYSNHNH